jgi:hypothetical protein
MGNTINNNKSTAKEIKSLFFYEHPEASKKEIYGDNKGKTGIYVNT